MRDRIAYTLSPPQYAAAVLRCQHRLASRMHTHGLWRIAGTVFACSLIYLMVMGILMVDIMGWERSEYVAIAAAVALFAYWLAIQSYRQGLNVLLRRGETLACGPHELLIEESGIWDLGPVTDTFIRWPAWKEVEEYDGLLVCHLDDFSFIALPLAAFASGEEKESFKALVRAKRVQAKEGPRTSTPMPFTPAIESGAAAGASKTGPGSLARAALRIAFLRRVDAAELGATWSRVIVAALVAMLVPTLFGALGIADAGKLDWDNLPAALFNLPLAVVTAVVVAQLLGRPRDVASLALAILLAWTVIDFLSLATYHLALQAAGGRPGTAPSGAWYYGPIVWLMLAAGRFALAGTPAPVPRGGWVMLACALLLALPLTGIERERSLWTRDFSRDADETAERMLRRYAAASEEAYYEQPKILERELAAVKPGRKGLIDVFFVGVAGYGHQDVFMREVDSVAKLFRERFDADGHIVTLVNNPKTVLTVPIASATSLRASLKRVAEQMDGDEDVLVLFLTSHGSADHKFSVDLWPLRLKELTPESLREILDGSGIKNRVLVVSACFSGGFVGRLQDPNTLVITAASTAKSSFGCSNENDWTYFGKAYFDEALRRTHSFTEAFEAARPVIARREREQKFDPSEPQMSLGEAIKEKLAKLEQQLDGEPSLK